MSETILRLGSQSGELVVETSSGSFACDAKFLVAAMLIFIAKGSGRIEQEESDTMLTLLEDYCGIGGAEALDLLTTAMAELAERPDLGASLAAKARELPEPQKEDLALMALKVIAADGRREVAEMEQFNRAAEAVGMTPELVHRAFDRFFAETMPDTGE